MIHSKYLRFLAAVSTSEFIGGFHFCPLFSSKIADRCVSLSCLAKIIVSSDLVTNLSAASFVVSAYSSSMFLMIRRKIIAKLFLVCRSILDLICIQFRLVSFVVCRRSSRVLWLVRFVVSFLLRQQLCPILDIRLGVPFTATGKALASMTILCSRAKWEITQRFFLITRTAYFHANSINPISMFVKWRCCVCQ